MSEQQQHWFAARTRDKQEFVTRDSLEKLRININLEYYLPTQFVIRQLKYRRKRVEVPVIRNLIFVRATKQDACDLSNKYGVQLYYIKDFSTRSMLIVPDKQMNDFMFLLDFSKEMVEVVNENLKKGDKVRVIKGDFAGIEGELIRVKGHKRVVVRLEGVVSLATAYIPSSFLEKIE